MVYSRNWIAQKLQETNITWKEGTPFPGERALSDDFTMSGGGGSVVHFRLHGTKYPHT